MQSALVSLAVVGTMLAASTAASAMGYGDLRSATVLGHPLSVAVPVRLDAGEDLSAECVRAEVYAGDARVDPASVRVRVTYGGERVRQVRVTTTVPIAEPIADVHVSIGCPPRLSRKFVVFADPPEFNLAQQAQQVRHAQQAPTVAPAVAEAPPAPAVAAVTQAVPAAVGLRSPAPSAAPAAPAPEPAPVRARPAAPARVAPQRARPPQPATAATRGASTGNGAAASRARPAAPAPESPRPRLRLDMVEPRPARTPPAPAPATRLAQADGTGGSRAAADVRAQAASDSRAQRVADARTRGRNGVSAAEAAASPAGAGPSPAASAAEAAARSAQAAQAAASAAEQRVRLLEVELARLRAESLATREQLAKLRAGAPAAADRYLPWLIGLAVLLLAVVGWLAWRLTVLARAQQRREAWYGVSELTSESARLEAHEAEEGVFAPAASASDETASPRASGAGTGAAQAAADAWAPSDAWAAPGPETVPAPPAPPKSASVPPGGTRLSAIAPAGRPREVTVEEQIDLEQQADFFMVLGQDEAAIDLLLTHLRGTGGASPMPYLKLLEIYRRRGDEEAYERIRDRFNQRFNGIVPPWTSDPNEGRSLEGYPRVLARVQAAWWSPLDAMAELEAMLYRKGERAERFDLPAYLDVLFLYQVARDLHQQEHEAQQGQSLVDVLLPIADVPAERAPSTRSAAPERPAARRRAASVPVDDALDLPRIDLDLSDDAAMPKA